MAKLPDEVLTTIFKLQRQLLELIDEATATESTLLEATISEIKRDFNLL